MPWKQPTCVACNDTGLNSRGGPCDPCLRRRSAEAISKLTALWDETAPKLSEVEAIGAKLYQPVVAVKPQRRAF